MELSFHAKGFRLYLSNEEFLEVFQQGSIIIRSEFQKDKLVVGKKMNWGGDQLQGMVKIMQKTGGTQETGFTDSLDIDIEGSGGDQKNLNAYTQVLTRW